MQIIKEYTYHASDEDSRNSSRDVALSKVKRLILEEMDIYLESQTEAKNSPLTKDHFRNLTAEILKTEILEDAWDGKVYWLKVKITATPQDMMKAVEERRKESKTAKELNEIKKKSEEFFEEYERFYNDLRGISDAAPQESEQSDDTGEDKLSVSGWLDRTSSSGLSGGYADDLKECTKAIEMNPQDAVAYYNRGTTYGKLGDFKLAVKDFNKALHLNARYAEAYYNRAVAYYKLGNYLMAVKNSNKAIEFNPQYAMAYYNRGIACFKLGSYQQSVKDLSKAIELNPQDAMSYFSRAVAYCELGDYLMAVKDCNKAIELDPEYTEAYYQRSIAFRKLENEQLPMTGEDVGSRPI